MSYSAHSALILSGGGARAAYQIGVLRAVNDILPKSGNPFDTFIGTSAGAINAVSLAAQADDFNNSINHLNQLWAELTPDNVFRTDTKDLLGGMFRIARSFFHEGVDYHRPLSLLDNSPLNKFLKDHIRFSNIQKHIQSGHLKAVSVTALGYTSTNSVYFFQGKDDLEPWRQARRLGVKAEIGVEHLLASTAIPWVFPTVRIGREFFGDGAIRQLAPTSPAICLHSDKVFVIGVSGNRAQIAKRSQRLVYTRFPHSLGQIAGHMLNSAFVDSLDSDLEHLETANQLLNLIPAELRDQSHLPHRLVDSLIISPSKEIDKIAGRHIRYMPKQVKFFLRSSGVSTKMGGAALGSYLLFIPSFIQELIELGYQDAMWEKEAILRFFDVNSMRTSN